MSGRDGNVLRFRPKLHRSAARQPEPGGADDDYEPFHGSLFDIALTHEPDRKVGDELIYGLLPTKQLVMLYGKSGCGKSTVACAMAHALTNGDDFLGLKTQQVGVLYLAAERADAVKRVIAAMDERAKVTTTGLAVAKTKGLNLLEQREAFAHEVRSARQYIRTETGLRCKLLILDTLSVAAPDSDESAPDFKELVEMLRDLAEQCSMTVLVIHHEGKDDRRGPRGSGALEAGFDATIKVMPIADRSARCGTLQVRKQNGDLDDAPISYTVEKVDWAVNNLGRMTQVTLVGRRTATAAFTDRKPTGKYEHDLKAILIPLFATTRGAQLPSSLRHLATAHNSPCLPYADVLAAVVAGLRERYPDAGRSLNQTAKRALEALAREGLFAAQATTKAVKGGQSQARIWLKGAWADPAALTDDDE